MTQTNRSVMKWVFGLLFAGTLLVAPWKVEYKVRQGYHSGKLISTAIRYAPIFDAPRGDPWLSGYWSRAL
jgi:hypothetical protein